MSRWSSTRGRRGLPDTTPADEKISKSCAEFPVPVSWFSVRWRNRGWEIRQSALGNRWGRFAAWVPIPKGKDRTASCCPPSVLTMGRALEAYRHEALSSQAVVDHRAAQRFRQHPVAISPPADPAWREDKVANLLTMHTEVHEQDPHPELPRCFTRKREVVELVQGVSGQGALDDVTDPGDEAPPALTVFEPAADEEGPRGRPSRWCGRARPRWLRARRSARWWQPRRSGGTSSRRRPARSSAMAVRGSGHCRESRVDRERFKTPDSRSGSPGAAASRASRAAHRQEFAEPK